MEKLKFNKTCKGDNFLELQKIVNQFHQSYDERKLNRSILLYGAALFFLFLIGISILWFSSAFPIRYFSANALLGVLSVPLILVIGHESVHGNFSRFRKMNRAGQFIFYFLGTCPYFWKLRHLSAHHHYTNIKKWDLDIEQSNFIRLSNGQQWSKIHRFQAFYMPVLFILYTLNWFFFRDFVDIKRHKFGSKHICQHPTKQLIWLFGSKLWHLSFLVLIPIVLGQIPSAALSGFLVFHFSASLTTTLVLVSTHVGVEHELIDTNDQFTLPYSWIEHQIRTTGNFSTNSTLALHFFGGFNHHLTHHLFPNIPYRLYPQITPLLQQYCLQNNLPFVSYSNLSQCVKSHFKRLTYYSKKI